MIPTDSPIAVVSKLLKAAEVAHQLQCSRALVYLLCERGLLSHHRVGLGRGTIRISPDDLSLYLAQHRTTERHQAEAPALATRKLKHIRIPR